MVRRLVRLVPAVAVLSSAGAAAAQTDAPSPSDAPPPAATAAPEAPRVEVAPSPPSAAPGRDEPRAAAHDDRLLAPDRFRGSVFFFDQSMTTQTVGLAAAQQSYVPLYEWWFSFRPKYHFTEKLSYTLRIDYTKEFTNDQATTNYREDVFGDIWNTVAYKSRFATSGTWRNTEGSLSARVLLPTSKVSQANGIFVTAGAGPGIRQTIPLRASSTAPFAEAHAGVSATYSHAFSRATSPTSGAFNYTRQDTEGRSFVSDQVGGTMLYDHQVLAVLDTGLQILPRWSLTLDMLWINNWKYAPKDEVTVQTATGPVVVPRDGDATRFTQNTWFIASTDYDLFDEVTLTLGYYNLANVIAPNGVARGVFGGDNVWWSPDARIFFTVTANLDKIYGDAVGAGRSGAPSSVPAPSGRAVSRLER